MAEAKCGKLLLKRGLSNEGVLEIKITGKWRGKIKVPKTATVGILKTHIAAASKIESGTYGKVSLYGEALHIA